MALELALQRCLLGSLTHHLGASRFLPQHRRAAPTGKQEPLGTFSALVHPALLLSYRAPFFLSPGEHVSVTARKPGLPEIPSLHSHSTTNLVNHLLSVSLALFASQPCVSCYCGPGLGPLPGRDVAAPFPCHPFAHKHFSCVTPMGHKSIASQPEEHYVASSWL